MKSKIIIIVRGGMVQEVRAASSKDTPEVMILDTDGLDNAATAKAGAEAEKAYPVKIEEEYADTNEA